MTTQRCASVLFLLTSWACSPGETDPTPADRAIDVLPDVGPTIVQDADLGPDDLILNRLEVVVRTGATSAGLDEALATVGGTLAAARPGLPYVTVTIPPATDLAGVEAEAELLEAHPDILFAGPAWMVGPPSLPAPSALRQQLTPAASGGADNAYLGEQRFFGAWNADALASHRTTVLVADFYTRPEPLPQLSVQRFIGAPTVEGAEIRKGRTGFQGNHGYWVTSLLAADADAVAPVGTHPHPETTLDVASLQILGVGGLIDLVLYMDRLLPTDGPFVLNTSFGFSVEVYEDERAIAALAWREILLRRTQPFLHLTSAGNDGHKNPESTLVNSIFSMQGTMDDLKSWMPTVFQAEFAPVWEDAQVRLGDSVLARRGTVLMVGASAPDGAESDFSNRGSDVRMTGEFMLGVCDRPTPDNACDSDGRMRADGTSASSPLAAGLAAWLMAIDPTLEPRDVSDLLVDSFDGRWVDALTATLALEARGVPVRRTLLDVGQDGAFDDADITSLLATFDVTEAAHPAANQEDRTWVRADLNGDGYARRDTAAPFDLDGDGQLGKVTVQVPGAEAASFEELELDERAVNDLQILCWGAYAGPFAGDPDARDDKLKEACQPPQGRTGTITSVLRLVCPHGERTTTHTATVFIDLTGALVSVQGNGVEVGSFSNVSPGDCVSHEAFSGPLVLEGDGSTSSNVEGVDGAGNLNLVYMRSGTTSFTGLDDCGDPQVEGVEASTVNLAYQRTAEGFYDFARGFVRTGDCEETLEVVGVLR